jgi:hypothetical protein
VKRTHIVVKDDDSLSAALDLLSSKGRVRYSDRYEFRTIDNSAALTNKCREALAREEIAIIAPIEEAMPEYRVLAKQVEVERREAKIAAEKKARQWIREHPREIAAMRKKLGI